MSRTIPIALAAKYAAGTARLCQCLRLQRRDGVTVFLTSAQNDVVVPVGTLAAGGADMGGVYRADPGINPTDIVQSAGLATDNLEIRFGKDDDYVTRGDVLQGVWNKTSYDLFICDPTDPGAGVDLLLHGYTGDFEINRNTFRAELRSIVQLLQQPVGEYTSKTCRARLFDSKCKVNPAAYTVTRVLTSVTSAQIVTDSARIEADDYFGDGLLRFNDGALAGVQVKVKAFTGGQFTFVLPMFAMPAVGDSYTVVAGCRKRHERTLGNPSGVSDCVDKFNNIYNFQGEPHLPGRDYLSSAP